MQTAATIPTTRRARGAEYMDDPSVRPELLATELRFLRVLNAVTGAGAGVAEEIAAHLAPRAGDEIRVADFGAGEADIGRGFLRLARARGWKARWHATDRSPDVLEIARRTTTDPDLTFGQVDVLEGADALGPRSHDVTHASLMLHHLVDADVVRALRQMGRVARRMVIWNDLVRDRAGLAGAAISTILGPRHLRHDAVQSVRRGFTLDEAEAIAAAAGLRVRSIRRWRHSPRFLLSAFPAEPDDTRGRPVIRADEIRVGYGRRAVLDGASLEVRAGEVRVLLGRNGSGKSTLLRALVGAAACTAGRVWCDRSGAPVGYLPQLGGLIGQLDAAANIRFTLEAAGWDRARIEPAIARALEEFAVAHLAHTRVDRISGGQARRVALAVAFAADPTAILLDEPESGLDTDGRGLLQQAVVAAARRGAGILVATHEPALLRDAATGAGIAFGEHRLENA
ncbi:MAG: ATP-binding cassette domain-containing protein [Phycisphaerales bacterium]